MVSKPMSVMTTVGAVLLRVVVVAVTVGRLLQQVQSKSLIADSSEAGHC